MKNIDDRGNIKSVRRFKGKSSIPLTKVLWTALSGFNVTSESELSFALNKYWVFPLQDFNLITIPPLVLKVPNGIHSHWRTKNILIKFYRPSGRVWYTSTWNEQKGESFKTGHIVSIRFMNGSGSLIIQRTCISKYSPYLTYRFSLFLDGRTLITMVENY